MSIRDVKAALANNHWIKGSFHSYQGDPEGSGRAVIDEDGNPIYTGHCLIGACDVTNTNSELIAEVIEEQYPDRIVSAIGRELSNKEKVVIFNDHITTTYRDVERVLDKAEVKESEING